MNRYFLKIFLFPLLFLFFFSYFYPGGKRILVGVVGPLTGINNFSGIEQLNGVELAFDIVNEQGGVKGYKLILLPCDDMGNPERSKECVLRLVNRGVVAILGAINSSCTLADMEITERFKIPLITSSSTATEITEKGNRYIFRCIDSDFFRMDALAEFLVDELNMKKFALFYEKDAYGIGLKKDFEKSLSKFGIKPVFLFPFERGERNFLKGIKRCKELKVDGVGLFGVTEDNIFIAEEIFRLGYKFKLFSPDVNEKYLTLNPQAVEGLIATDSFYLRRNKRVFKDFARRYVKKYGIPPGPIAGRAYDAANILIDSLKRAKRFRGKDIRDAILEINNFHGVTGDFNFKPNGDVVKKFSIIEIRNGTFVSPYGYTKKGKGLWKILLIFGLFLVILNVVLLKILHGKKGVRKEGREKIFKGRTLKKNPYIVGNPIRDSRMFFGRDEDFRFIKNNISRDSGSIVLLYGERRSGKSSILYQILNGRFGRDVIPFLFDLQLFSEVEGNVEFMKMISSEIKKCEKQCKFLSNTFKIEEILDSLTEFYRGKKVLFMFDEYEIIGELIQRGKISSSLLNLLSGFIEKYPNLNYVFAGTREFGDESFWQPLFNKSVSKKVSFLSKKDTFDLIKKPVKFYFSYENSVVERIYRLTNGHPFYTQAICMYIVDYMMEREKGRVNFVDFMAVLQEMLDNPLPEMFYFWGNLSFDEKVILALLGEVLERESEVVSTKSLWNYLLSKRYPVDISHDRLSLLLEALYARDILNKFRDGFNFKMDFFRLWIRKDHSIWQVIGSEGKH